MQIVPIQQRSIMDDRWEWHRRSQVLADYRSKNLMDALLFHQRPFRWWAFLPAIFYHIDLDKRIDKPRHVDSSGGTVLQNNSPRLACRLLGPFSLLILISREEFC